MIGKPPPPPQVDSKTSLHVALRENRDVLATSNLRIPGLQQIWIHGNAILIFHAFGGAFLCWTGKLFTSNFMVNHTRWHLSFPMAQCPTLCVCCWWLRSCHESNCWYIDLTDAYWHVQGLVKLAAHWKTAQLLSNPPPPHNKTNCKYIV